MNDDGIVFALFLVIARQPQPDIASLGADDGVLAGIEGFAALKGFHANGIFLEFRAAALYRRLNHVAQQGSLPFGGSERAAGKDSLQLLPDVDGNGSGRGRRVQIRIGRIKISVLPHFLDQEIDSVRLNALDSP